MGIKVFTKLSGNAQKDKYDGAAVICRCVNGIGICKIGPRVYVIGGTIEKTKTHCNEIKYYDSNIN